MMKTGTKIALLIGIFLLALGATLFKIAYGRGESVSARIKTKKAASVQAGYTVCLSGEERFDAGEIERLKIDWASGAARIEPYDGDEILVREKANEALDESDCLRWRVRGGELSILSRADSLGFLTQLPDKELTVLVPESWIAREIELDGASADWSVRALNIQDELAIDTASGDVTIEDLRCGTLDIDSASGDLSLASLSCDRMELDTASGSISADALVCREAETDTASGEVRLAFAEAPRSVDVDSGSGDVTLLFPKGTGLKLDYDTASGKLHGDYEGGSLPLRVDTASGDLTIEYR